MGTASFARARRVKCLFRSRAAGQSVESALKETNLEFFTAID